MNECQSVCTFQNLCDVSDVSGLGTHSSSVSPVLQVANAARIRTVRLLVPTHLAASTTLECMRLVTGNVLLT
jgi:galactokinase/mevalonate kinase-like predicted kinase